jgi:ubiquinone/menaquinone biosynthesis C-methylase UbiE
MEVFLIVSDSREGFHRPCQGRDERGKRHSSFRMHDPEVVFHALALREGHCVADMGCGPGEYAIEAAQIVGTSGMVYALDRSQPLIAGLSKEAGSRGLTNVKAIKHDICDPLPIEDGCVDVCLLSTVLHVFDLAKVAESLFGEVRRVLKSDGRVAIIECKKEDQPFGPPKHMRLSPEDVERSIIQYGFKTVGLVDLGYNYIIQFEAE